MKIRIFLVIFSCFVSILIGLFISKGKIGNKNIHLENNVDKNKQILIGFSMDTLKESRWQNDRKFFIEKAKELNANVLVQAANSDDTKQIQDIEALISRKVDVLVIVPHNGKAMAKAVKLAHKANIPVIAYDRLISDCNLDLYITFDGFKVGQLQAQYIIDTLLPKKEKAKIIRIYGSKMDHNAFLFKEGQDDILSDYIKQGKVEIMHEDWADEWKAENAKKIVNAAITKYGNEFDAILASNDGTATGAIQALIEENLIGKVIVTGQDAELIACQRIATNMQSMTIYKPIKDLASKAVEFAIKMAKKEIIVVNNSVSNGEKNVPSVLLDVTVVTKDNLKETVIKDGFHKSEDIYK